MNHFILRDRNKDNINTMICVLYGFGAIFTGLMFNAKSAKESLATLIYSYASFTRFPYQILMPFFLRIVLWRFISSKMAGVRCFKTSIFLSMVTLSYLHYFASNPSWLSDVMLLASIYFVFIAFYNALFHQCFEVNIQNYFEETFYPEDIFFLTLLSAGSSEIFFMYPWNKAIFIRVTSWIFMLLIFIFVLEVHIPHNTLWRKQHKDNSLFAPRNCLMNCFFLFLFESIWAGWEMSYGSGLEVVTLSQITFCTLLFLLMTVRLPQAQQSEIL